MHRRKWLHEIIWGVAALGIGVALVGMPTVVLTNVLQPSAFSFSSKVKEETAQAASLPVNIQPPSSESASTTQQPSDSYPSRTLGIKTPEIPKVGTAVVADLGEMMLRIYQDGVVEKEYPIRSKGKPGSLWETPTGVYSIKTKEERHFSSIGNVWMPYSMQFFANFFIHGWPSYPSGKPVAEGFSGGCIRMSDEAAREVFARVGKGTPVMVTNNTPASPTDGDNAALSFFAKDAFTSAPSISAENALVADVETGHVFYEKNASEQKPIASISKLVTALVSVEAVNQNQTVVISEGDVKTDGDAGDLRVGEEFKAGQLLWPLLLASSNDASTALSRTIGVNHFVSLMNEKARGLGLADTGFEEPSGLSPGDHSTATDLFRLSQYLWNNKRSILDITRERRHARWRNIHPFAAKDSFLGGKVGFTPEAKKTIVSLFTLPFGEFNERRTVAVVLLGSKDIRADTERLRVWARDNFLYGLRPSTALASAPRKESLVSEEPFSLLFAGDMMMNRGVEKKIKNAGGGDWNFPFKLIGYDLSNADITFANLEGPVSDQGADLHNLYSFHMNPAVIDAIKTAGVDIVSLANNHIGDWGRSALEDTMRRLHKAGIEYAGAGWNRVEALSPAIFELRGKRIGYLAFSDVGPTALAAGEATPGIALADLKTVQNATRLAAAQVDILVVSFHYGDEYQLEATERQKELAHAAIDAGARVVVGHHPHVVEPVEEYDGGIILYSLGNFIFDQYFSKETMSGMLVKIEFEGDNITATIPMPVTLNKDYQPVLE